MPVIMFSHQVFCADFANQLMSGIVREARFGESLIGTGA